MSFRFLSEENCSFGNPGKHRKTVKRKEKCKFCLRWFYDMISNHKILEPRRKFHMDAKVVLQISVAFFYIGNNQTENITETIPLTTM